MTEEKHIETISDLTVSVTDLIKSTAVSLEVSISNIQAQRKRSAYILFGLGGVVILLLMFVFIVAVQNNKVGNDVRRNSGQIVDCTSPGGGCFSRVQTQLNEKIAFQIQDEISHNTEVLNLLLSCSDPSSQSLCAKQLNSKLAKLVHDAVTAALKEVPR